MRFNNQLTIKPRLDIFFIKINELKILEGKDITDVSIFSIGKLY